MQTNTKDEQAQVIESALQALARVCDGANEDDGQGFNGVDAGFGHTLAESLARYGSLTARQEYTAYKMMRKYWRQLKKAGITLPKEYQNRYALSVMDDEQATIKNLSKGSEYRLIRDSWGDITCDCQAGSSGALCGHIKYASDHWPMNTPVQESHPEAPAPIVEPTDTGLEILPGITATECQAKALDELMEFATDPGRCLHLLSGAAGCGKTLVIQALIKRLRDEGDPRSIVFTAPTNKATEVLRSMVSRWGLGVECITCAKLLALRPVINRETGVEEFKKSYQEDPTIQTYDLVIVDEASMVNAELYGYLVEEANILTKLLFVGDRHQLPPVGEAVSQVFTETPCVSTLTEIKRYSGPIAIAADDIRRNLGRRGEPLFSSEYSPDGQSGLFVLTEDSWKQNLLRAFSSPTAKAEPDYCRALAWRNKTVESLNAYIRQGVLGTNVPRFVIGERLLATDHYGRPDALGIPKTLFATSAEMEVRNVYEGRQGDWLAWFLDVEMLDAEGMTYTIPVLHESVQMEWERNQALIRAKALKGDKGQWQTYHDNRKAFAWVDYAYAMTVHKSQGSTFKNVFLDVGDILANRTENVISIDGEQVKVREKNQLLYVALTRAANRVFVFE